MPDSKIDIKNFEDIEQVQGVLEKSYKRDKLMNSVIEGNKENIEKGKMINEAINRNFFSFNPDTIFEQFVESFKFSRQTYGDSLIRQITGYDADFVDANKKIPEFQKELKKRIYHNLEKLREDALLDKEGFLTEKAYELASLILYLEELERLVGIGLIGEKTNKKSYIYGSNDEIKNFSKGDSYKQLAIRKSIKTAIRRGHKELRIEDLRSFQKVAKGQIYIIYAIDASGSMKGRKIEAAKKAGIALAFKAIEEKDKVGLIVFGDEIKTFVEPTYDFATLLKKITKIQAARETNIAMTIKKAIEMYPPRDVTKHLVFLTDALPTVGKEPVKATLDAVSLAREAGITISLIGINLDEKGKKLAEEIIEVGDGKLYVVKDIENLDTIVLADYYSIS